MQQEHDHKLHIDAPQPPPCFMGLVEKGSPFLRKRKPSMGLSFQLYPVVQVLCLLTIYPQGIAVLYKLFLKLKTVLWGNLDTITT